MLVRARLARAAATLVAGLLGALLLPAVPAWAHGQLVESVPTRDSTITAPVDAVALSFTEKPASNAYFSITGPDGGRLDHGWYHGEPKQLDRPVQELFLVNGEWQPRLFHTGFPVRITVAHWPAAGRYVARYLSIASDGEPVRGEVAFTYTGPSTAAPTGWQPPTNQPDPALLAAGQTPTPTGAARPAVSAESGPSAWVWLGPVVLVVVAGLVVLRAARRPVPASAPRSSAKPHKPAESHKRAEPRKRAQPTRRTRSRR